MQASDSSLSSSCWQLSDICLSVFVKSSWASFEEGLCGGPKIRAQLGAKDNAGIVIRAASPPQVNYARITAQYGGRRC